ncbi:SMI1/KNR4 family protein [Streptomyces sp. NPDC005251]|uniref:SMI1/KNR4 family protein n=1 Tax=Streptomyces sp. NPDC005251 TaxID=3157166 RepID=UPI0033B6F763
MNRLAVPPRLTEAEVVEAEVDLGVAFPGEYRRYLLQVSSGGAVAQLEKTENGWWWAGNSTRRRDLLPLPFPHPDSYEDADDEFYRRLPRAEDYPDGDAFAEPMNAWNTEYWDFDERKTAGSVVAEEHGCGFATLLVITGPLAGTLWWDGRATCDLIIPLSLDHAGGARPVTFSEWLGRNSWDLLPPGWG